MKGIYPGIPSRRQFLQTMLLCTGAVVSGCTPMRAIFKLYDDRFDEDPELVDAYLRAFVVTVIPGANPTDPNLTRIFRDPRFGFQTHIGLFAADLARRSRQRFGDDRFDTLDEARRAAIVQSGLDGDAVTSQLYHGAIFAAQVSFYGSIYDDDGGCALIDFPGTNMGFDDELITYPRSASLLGPYATCDGNPA